MGETSGRHGRLIAIVLCLIGAYGFTTLMTAVRAGG